MSNNSSKKHPILDFTFPEATTPEEKAELEKLSEKFLDEIPLSTLGFFCVEEIFGDQIYDQREDLFLTSFLDETQPIQSEFAAKLSATFKYNGFAEPEQFVVQVFKRKGGFDGKINVSNDEFDGETPIHKYVSAICLKDCQIVNFENTNYIIPSKQISPVFEIKDAVRDIINVPRVPKNKTRLTLKDGKVTIKPRNYLCILVWSFWGTNPTQEQPSYNFKELEKLLKEGEEGGYMEKIKESETKVVEEFEL